MIVAMWSAAFERILIQPLENRSVRAGHPHPRLFFILNGGAATIWGTARTPIPAPFPGGLDDKFDIITDRVPNFFSPTRRWASG